MTDQLFETPEPTLGSCAWCGESPVGYVILEPPTHGKHIIHETPVEKKRAKTAAVCRKHSGIVDNQPKFYSCGCSHVPGEDKCERHHKSLARRGKFVEASR